MGPPRMVDTAYSMIIKTKMNSENNTVQYEYVRRDGTRHQELETDIRSNEMI